MSEYEIKNCRPKAPEGFEYTGEWREPKVGEWFRLDNGSPMRAASEVANPYHILTPVTKERGVCLPDPKPGYEWRLTDDAHNGEWLAYEQWPIKKTYNWDKTEDTAKLILEQGFPRHTWLYNDLQRCPFDANAVYVDIITRGGDRGSCVDPQEYTFLHNFGEGDIIAVKFHSLKPGYEF